MNRTTQIETVAQVLYWLVDHRKSQPTLSQLSRQFDISEFHLQRTFQEYVGVSPKQFLKHLGKEEALRRLKHGESVLDTSLDIGLSGPGRLHDLLVTTEAMTPGQVRNQGKGVTMQYGFGATPFGDALIAWTDRGISFLAFCETCGREHSLTDLRGQWKDVHLKYEERDARVLLERVFELGSQPSLKVWLRGSPFQLKVWEALLKIPPDAHCTYGQIARHLGNPRASRAVGTAIGRNPVSFLIPCHRVITSMGTMGGYRWGIPTKRALIGLESGLSRGAA
jgi:AraC family transcriptional regulator of adaptative response/methylated-DNA-[protein]-cysteine methyltransferase